LGYQTSGDLSPFVFPFPATSKLPHFITLFARVVQPVRFLSNKGVGSLIHISPCHFGYANGMDVGSQLLKEQEIACYVIDTFVPCTGKSHGINAQK